MFSDDHPESQETKDSHHLSAATSPWLVKLHNTLKNAEVT